VEVGTASGEGAGNVSAGRGVRVRAAGTEVEEAREFVGAMVHAGRGEEIAGVQAVSPVKIKTRKTVRGLMSVSYGQVG
jgi:hypothetical protein